MDAVALKYIVPGETADGAVMFVPAELKDVETRRQGHIIKDELAKLAKDFGRFDERMRRLADHIRLANEDAQQVQVSSRKISERFPSIERVEMEQPETPQLRVVERRDDKAG